jgi:DNA-directed RNA polymerase specialized sigma24 family protein
VANLSGDETQRRNRAEDDARLLTGVRRNDANALREFAKRFEPLLRDQARRLGVSKDDRRTVVTGFLDDILVKLADSAAPRSLPSFVVTSFRNFVVDMHREASERERRTALQCDMTGAEHVIMAGCSEFMLRAAEGPEMEYDAATPRPGDDLVHALFDGCSAEDRLLLVWSAHRVPLRECAAWLGISYDSAKQRLSRLRARLIRESIARLPQLPASDRAELLRRLHSAGVRIDDDKTEGSAA